MYFPPSFPPVVICYRTIVKCQNQDIDIGAVHTLYSDLTSFACTCSLCNFITCVDLCNHRYNQDKEPSITYKAILYSNTHSLTLPALP